MRAAISGMGQWLAESVRGNEFWPDGLVASWRDRSLDRSGVDGTLAAVPQGAADQATARYFAEELDDPFLRSTRRHADETGISSCEASARAARAALEDAQVDPSEVEVVLVNEAVPDRPSTSAPKIAELAGARGARAMTCDAGCASPILQLETACALIESGRARTVLCVQGHVVTRAFPMAHPALPLLSDTATAFVVSASERSGVLGIAAQSDGALHHAVCWVRGRDDASDTPWWTTGAPLVLGSRDRERAQQIIRETLAMGARTVREAAARARARVAELDVLVSVQPRRWVPGGIAEALDLPAERAVHTFDRIAHVGGCCAVANLLEARDRGLLREGTRVGLYAQGMGFTRAAAIVEWRAR
jgi:3-oxoacyl-[acyl-carrier-protein] synthase-3